MRNSAWLSIARTATALAAAMGIGRFAYTPILPLMTAHADLTAQAASQLATANYVGYLIGAVAAAATEQADDRIWRTLPGSVSVARGYLPAGEHRLVVDGRDSGQVVTVSGQYMLVPVQLLGAAVTVGTGRSSSRAEFRTCDSSVPRSSTRKSFSPKDSSPAKIRFIVFGRSAFFRS